MILCDTNILIEFYKINQQIIQELRQIGHNHLAVNPITQAELYFGALNRAELIKIKKHLSLLTIIPFDLSVSIKFVQIMETYSLSHKLGIPDALIAATALAHNLELYTLDTKDFHFISGLRIYHPVTL